MNLQINRKLVTTLRRFLLPQPAPPPAEDDAFKSRSNAGFVRKRRGEIHSLLYHKLQI
jgi:hypothetical protein